MAIARVTILDFADEESKKRNLQLYEQRWKEVFPNMQMNMIIMVDNAILEIIIKNKNYIMHQRSTKKL